MLNYQVGINIIFFGHVDQIAEIMWLVFNLCISTQVFTWPYRSIHCILLSVFKSYCAKHSLVAQEKSLFMW